MIPVLLPARDGAKEASSVSAKFHRIVGFERTLDLRPTNI
jgi:hypothetical protein